MIRRLYNGLTVVTKGESFQNFCRKFGQNELEQKITLLSNNLSQNYLTLAYFDLDTVARVFNLMDIHIVHFAGFANHEEFSKIFDEDLRDIVRNALATKKEAIAKLADPKIAERIDSTITDPKINTLIEQRLTEVKSQRQEASLRLQVLVNRMKAHITMAPLRAHACGVHVTTYNNGLKGRTSVEHIELMIASAEEYLRTVESDSEPQKTEPSEPVVSLSKETQKPTPKEPEEPEPKTEAKSEADTEFEMPVMGKKKRSNTRSPRIGSNGDKRPKPSSRPTRIKKNTKKVSLESIGGSPSPTGVELCLTKNGFASLNITPSTSFIEDLKTQVQITRGLINVCSQIKDTRIRAKLRDEMDLELAELELAIRQFSYEYPGKLSELFDSSREHLASQPNEERQQ